MAIVNLADGVGEDNTGDGADALFVREQAGREKHFKGPATNVAGNAADDGHSRFLAVEGLADDQSIMPVGQLLAGRGLKVHVNQVAALRDVGLTAHTVSLPAGAEESHSP